MKKYYILLACIMVFTSCSDWLDVSSDSEVEKTELFKTEEGFIEALNGVYSRCTKSDIYGNELTFRYLDVLAQNYTFSSDYMGYRETSEFNYNDPLFISRKDATWNGLYNALSNCNLIIENIDSKESLFLNDNYKLVKGEAFALRAYLHFDLFRLFAPSYVTNPDAEAIPYVTSFSVKVTLQYTVTEVLEKIIADLNTAKLLLEDVDPILSDFYKVGYEDDENTAENEGILFLQNRRHRLNYYGVCASLARAYLCLGNNTEALNNALEVINSEKFPWTKKEAFTEPDLTKRDRILYTELIFSWYIPTANISLRQNFENGTTSLITNFSQGNAIFEVNGVGADDLRYKNWLSKATDGISEYLQLVKYHREEDENKHELLAPAIRLSEMYYIVAEATFDSNPAEAWGYFNTVRKNRGIGTEISDESSSEKFKSELIKECRKEFFGEGQIFHMYKRLNRDIVGHSGVTIPADNKIFVLPLPNDEMEFGQRN